MVAKSKRDSQQEDPKQVYRANVAAILERKDGKILVGERIGRPDAWQFPQGGVDEGETPRKALYREVKEEIGVGKSLYKVLESKGGYRYKFPDGHARWKKFCGQEQTYFRCRFLGKNSDIDVDRENPEFSDFRWIWPKKFDLDWLPKFKRAVYREVLADFYGV
jgi:putative (di)nucleoside polyphosphate hydrolase